MFLFCQLYKKVFHDTNQFIEKTYEIKQNVGKKGKQVIYDL